MRKQFVSSTLDSDAVRILSAIATAECEGNKSMALRKVVREAARARGWAIETTPRQPVKTTEGVRP
jgi:hypothetical protein